VGTAILHRATAFSHLHASNSGIYYPGPIHDSTESVYEISESSDKSVRINRDLGEDPTCNSGSRHGRQALTVAVALSGFGVSEPGL
jgi:hypothetical protein